ncbi:MAG: UDP-N-acetylglucosamine 2-epimerase (non-hydrolyzing) [Methanomassiliicoccales archaeon]|nr:UDP-N-acetylglucosamine 2-epimerase (non-hydrolyzing) [Methanomassiliicoccales archaeon]NYT14474.1 UDP-N-acetylglucosamine 2-epimerase (non-hydrolyzing) [Methanomassiliicoccales archaeon]
MKILSIVGARPQFIKLAPLHPEVSRRHEHIIVHTGQHYDYEMSQVFFEELSIPDPNYNLGIGSGTHAEQTGAIMLACERTLLIEEPDVVLVYGDTNSTLAAGLAAAKLNIPIAHVEAGLRSFNRKMPEEINRILTDHLSTAFLCPSQASVENLRKEGKEEHVHLVGDTMVQTLLMIEPKLTTEILTRNELKSGQFVLCTVHRQDNADSIENMESIIGAMIDSDESIVFPIHPRTKKNLDRWKMLPSIQKAENIVLLPPQGFLSFISLEKHAKAIMTDSGGVQKEAFFFRVPCITMRCETEWVETVDHGWNVLVGSDRKSILDALENLGPGDPNPTSYGDVHVATRIVEALEDL